MSRKKKKTVDVASSCERILALLKASQRQLEYLAHEHLSFEQVLRVEQELRVGSSPERAEIQRMRLLLDARLDHVRQMRAITSLAPLTFMPSEKERIQELQSLQSFVQPYSKDDSSKGEQSEENGPNPIATEAKLRQSAADSAMDPAFQARDLGSLEESSKPVVSPSDNSPPETVPQAQAEAETEAEAQAAAEAATEAQAAAEAKAEAEAQAEAEVEAKSIPESATEHIPKPAIDSAKSPEAPETPSTPIPLAAAPIALGGSPVQSSETGLSIQVLQSSPETSIDKSPSTLLDGKLKELMRRATTAHSDGEIERAIEAYSDLLDQADDHVPTLLARGRCHLEKKDFSAAISDFRRAQTLLPNDPSPLVALGDLFLSRKDHDTAIGHFDSAIALQKDHPQARCRRGLAHYHCGRYRQAFLDLQRAYKLDPEIPNIRRLVQMAIRKLEENP